MKDTTIFSVEGVKGLNQGDSSGKRKKIQQTWEKIDRDRMGRKGNQRYQKMLKKQMIKRTGSDSSIRENNTERRGWR